LQKIITNLNLGGFYMAKDVACSVDSCTYWEHGNKCSANKIKVNNVHSDERAYKSDETSCETFKPNSSL
jgi:hypothetical protein